MKGEVERGFFTSDLSVNEFLLVKQSGFEPLGLVLGSSIYHIGWQQAGWNQSQELGVLTQAMYHARELALELGQSGRRTVGEEFDVHRSARQLKELFGGRAAESGRKNGSSRPLTPDAATGR